MEEDDPLELRNLAVSYDYLLFKIKDQVSTLTEITQQSVQNKQMLIEEKYFKEELNLENEFKEIDALFRMCDEIQLNFLKLDQLVDFVADFRSRLEHLEEEFDKLR
ncbi:uncharacterized protein PRCAT00000659001 [Priceomyces carsonii]|uniref:uncharacterized protein n=1 Tax=Priceomyces carsonii TaxID=28549 RepID=UPI002EDA896B|nr:unnamed protein product [Priceomyces carsonii]